MREMVRLRRCLGCIATYQPQEPLSAHLKRYFRSNRDMGSTDRRQVRELIYHYFRLGTGLPGLPPEKRMAVAAYIFMDQPDAMHDFLTGLLMPVQFPAGLKQPADRFEAVRLNFPELKQEDLFPLIGNLSDGIKKEDWLNSLFTRSLVWIRIRKGFEERVISELQAGSIPFHTVPGFERALGFEPDTALDGLHANREGWFEIQDLSSQKTSRYFDVRNNQEEWWDCCAGSGGKSLLLLDRFPKVTLTVSDVRETILVNLVQRLRKAGYSGTACFAADLMTGPLPEKKFDSIILDAPCSGSGTWNRTPERICFFSADEINGYAHRQRQILLNASQSLKPQGRIIYITCSVFRQENEEVITYAEDKLDLKCMQSEVLNGYSFRADTLFIALLEKRSGEP